MKIEISRGGTLRSPADRRIVRTCAAHGDFIVAEGIADRALSRTECPQCGGATEFKGYTVDSVVGRDRERQAEAAIDAREMRKQEIGEARLRGER